MSPALMEHFVAFELYKYLYDEERVMGFGRGALLWLIEIPIPIILLIAVFMHH